MLNVLSLFAGIGGFDLGLERTGGFKTVAFCEINPYARRVLAKHWPGVRQYGDVKTLTASRLAADGIAVDVVAGGFPCQDISTAGAGAGLNGDRSGLWFEMLRIIGEVKPHWVIIENVPALRSRGLDTVLGGLAAIGYNAEWHCIPAASLGAPHRRDRIWIIAYPGGEGRREVLRGAHGDEGADGPQDMLQPRRDGAVGDVADADGGNTPHGNAGQGRRSGATRRVEPAGLGREMAGQGDLADAGQPGLSLAQPEGGHGPVLSEVDIRRAAERCGGRGAESGLGQSPDGLPGGLDGGLTVWGPGWEDGIPRVAHGVPNRVARLRCLGNAVVPQIPEMIGRAILAAYAP